jgi:hypothetical protein
MRIVRLTADRFRGLPDGSWAFGPADHSDRLTLVEGPPASGKTSLLDAIATAKELVGAYGALPAAERLLRAGATRGRLEATWRLEEPEARFAETEEIVCTTCFTIRAGAPYELTDPGLRRLFASHPVRTPVGCGGLELFDAGRDLPAVVRRGGDEGAELAMRAMRGGDRYAGLVPWMVRRILRDGVDALDAMDRGGVVATWDRDDVLRDVRIRIRRLLPDLHLERVDPGPGGTAVRFARRDGAGLELAHLSDGERAKVLFAIAFRRFSLDHGIALIDDVDRGLPPEGRGELLRGLADLGRETQIIAATRSPRPAAELPKHHRIVLGGGT